MTRTKSTVKNEEKFQGLFRLMFWSFKFKFDNMKIMKAKNFELKLIRSYTYPLSEIADNSLDGERLLRMLHEGVTLPQTPCVYLLVSLEVEPSHL